MKSSRTLKRKWTDCNPTGRWPMYQDRFARNFISFDRFASMMQPLGGAFGQERIESLSIALKSENVFLPRSNPFGYGCPADLLPFSRHWAHDWKFQVMTFPPAWLPCAPWIPLDVCSLQWSFHFSHQWLYIQASRKFVWRPLRWRWPIPFSVQSSSVSRGIYSTIVIWRWRPPSGDLYQRLIGKFRGNQANWPGCNGSCLGCGIPALRPETKARMLEGTFKRSHRKISSTAMWKDGSKEFD